MYSTYNKHQFKTFVGLIPTFPTFTKLGRNIHSQSIG
jgi:hypothetical protein